VSRLFDNGIREAKKNYDISLKVGVKIRGEQPGVWHHLKLSNLLWGMVSKLILPWST
jgi:hypothetical protein